MGVGGLVLAITRGFNPGLIWMQLGAGFVAVLGFCLFTQSISWLLGDKGERRTLALLGGLSDDYTALTNWVVPGTKQGDIDLLVTGPHGVLVVEIKTYASPVASDGDKWYSVKENGYRKPIKSLSNQTKRNGAVVQKLLRSKGLQVPVHTVLVFNDKAEINCSNPTVPILHRGALQNYILRLPSAGTTVSAEALMS